MSVTIKVIDGGTPLVAEINRVLKDGSVEEAMGKGATNAVKSHLFKINSSRPNKLGGQRTNFYSDAAKSTSFTFKPGSVEINVNKVGIRQRVEGGTIRPVNKKFLTIPAVAEAHGRQASEFKLNLATNSKGEPYALVDRGTGGFSRKKRKFMSVGSTEGRVIFWLAKQAVQKADPSVMPTEEEVSKAAMIGLDGLLRTLEPKIRPIEGGTK